MRNYILYSAPGKGISIYIKNIQLSNYRDSILIIFTPLRIKRNLLDNINYIMFNIITVNSIRFYDFKNNE